MRGKAGLCEPRRSLKWQDKTRLNCGAVMVGWSATGESWHCVIWQNKLGEFSGRGELGVSWMGHVTGQGWTKLGAKWCSSGEVWRMICGEVWRCATTYVDWQGAAALMRWCLAWRFDMGWGRVRHNL